MGLRGSSDDVVGDFMGSNRGKPDPRDMKDILANRNRRTGDVIRPSTFGDQQRHRQSHFLNKPALVGPQQPVYRSPGASKHKQTLKEGVRGHVEFYFGSTPKEFAYGEATGAAISVVGGVAWKAAKGLYRAGKGLYKTYKHIDSMVPGNRPPRPKTPPAPVNPASIESRRNVLKGGLVVAAGGAAAATKNMEEAVNIGEQVLRKVKGRRLIPRGWIGESATTSLKRLTKASDDFFYVQSGMKGFKKKFGHDSDSWSGMTARDIADFLSEGNKISDIPRGGKKLKIPDTDETIPKILNQPRKTNKEIIGELREYADDADYPHTSIGESVAEGLDIDELVMGVGEKFLRNSADEIVEKTQKHIPEKLKPFMNVVDNGNVQQQIMDTMQTNIIKSLQKQGYQKGRPIHQLMDEDVYLQIGKIASRSRKQLAEDVQEASDTLKKHKRSLKEGSMPDPNSGGPMMPRERIRFHERGVRTWTRKLAEDKAKLGARMDLPEKTISEIEVKNILKKTATTRRTGKFEADLKSLRESDGVNKSVRERELRKQFDTDLKIIDQAKRTRGRFAQNRSPFV